MISYNVLAQWHIFFRNINYEIIQPLDVVVSHCLSTKTNRFPAVVPLFRGHCQAKSVQNVALGFPAGPFSNLFLSIIICCGFRVSKRVISLEKNDIKIFCYSERWKPDVISGFFQAHFHKIAKNPFCTSCFLLANVFVQLCRSALFHLLKYKLQRSAIAT